MYSYSKQLNGCLEDIVISDITPSTNQLRDTLNNLDELAESIKAIGLLQPIVVRTNSASNFEVVAGSRRLKACKTLGWRKIACHLVELDDKQAFEASIIENVQRNTLNPIEEGLAYRKYVREFGWGGVSELAEKLSKSSSYICKRIKLSELPKEVIDLISNTEIKVSTAEELLALTNKKEQSELAQIIREKKLSSRKVRKLVKDDRIFTCNHFSFVAKDDQLIYSRERIGKSFDKTILALRIAIKKLGPIIEGVEDDWIFYDILLHHKNMLNSQIDLLIKEKKKFKRKIA